MMRIFKQGLLLLLALTLLSAVTPRSAYSWKPWRKRTKSTVKQQNRVLSSKKYQYIRSHDYNKDGKVDTKDRLMWLNEHKGGSSVVYISDENEDIMEIMDINSNGNVESWEMDQFYSKYDLNGNGILEDQELDMAVD